MLGAKIKEKAIALGTAAAVMGAAALPVHAAGTQTATSEGTLSVPVSVTVNSNFTIELPMAIGLEDANRLGDNGPVFASPSSVKMGVKGQRYGKHLLIAAKDGRTGSPTHGTETLTLTKASYDSDTGRYTIEDGEDAEVECEVKMEAKDFYPLTEDAPGEAVNIIKDGDLTTEGDQYTYYPFSVETTGRVRSDASTLYYGEISFVISTPDIS